MATLIIGGGGFIGRALVESLKKDGETIHVWSSQDEESPLDPETGGLAPGTSIPDGTHCVVFLSQSPRYRDPKAGVHLMQVNGLLPLQVLDLAVKAGVKKFIYMSTGSVYAPSLKPLTETSAVVDDNWYKLSKLTGEKSLALVPGDVQICIVRPFGVFGPGQKNMLVANLIDNISQSKVVSVNRSSPSEETPEGLRISLCYLDDAVKILKNLFRASDLPPVINLAGTEPVSIRRLGETIADNLGVDLKLEVTDQVRNFDLIADTQLMEKFVDFEMTSLQAAIKATVEAQS